MTRPIQLNLLFCRDIISIPFETHRFMILTIFGRDKCTQFASKLSTPSVDRLVLSRIWYPKMFMGDIYFDVKQYQNQM